MNWTSEAQTLGFLTTWRLNEGEPRLGYTAWKMGCWWNKNAETTPVRIEGRQQEEETWSRVLSWIVQGFRAFPVSVPPALLGKKQTSLV